MRDVPIVAPSRKYLALAATSSSAEIVWSSARGLKPVYKGSTGSRRWDDVIRYGAATSKKQMKFLKQTHRTK